MKTVLKIALGIILAFTVLIVGCVAIIGAGVDEAVDEVQKESDKTSITQAEYQSVKVGPEGNTRDRIVSRLASRRANRRLRQAT